MVPPMTWKLNIWAAKMKAAITPIRGMARSSRVSFVFLTASAMAAIVSGPHDDRDRQRQEAVRRVQLRPARASAQGRSRRWMRTRHSPPRSSTAPLAAGALDCRRDPSLLQRVATRGPRRAAYTPFHEPIRIADRPTARRSAGVGDRPGAPARTRPALDAATARARRGPRRDRGPRHRRGAGRALPGARPGDDPLDDLPDPRRPRGARRRPPRPRSERPRGVPRPARRRARPPPLQDLWGSWEISFAEAAGIVGSLDAERGFEVDLSHVTIVGRCRACRG